MRYRLSIGFWAWTVVNGGERTKTVSDGGPDVTKINSKLHFKFYVTAALGNLGGACEKSMSLT